MESRDNKELLKFKELEHVKIEKAEQLFKDMLESMDFERARDTITSVIIDPPATLDAPGGVLGIEVKIVSDYDLHRRAPWKNE